MKLRSRKWFGTLLFFVSLPGLYAYLRLEERTRVVITVGDEVLMLKGWYGSNRWMLPGGGAHQDETALMAAIREVREETGIKLRESDLRVLESDQQWDTFGLRYMCHSFGVALPRKPTLNIENPEISHAAWLPVRKVAHAETSALKVSRRAVAAWSKAQNLL